MDAEIVKAIQYSQKLLNADVAHNAEFKLGAGSVVRDAISSTGEGNHLFSGCLGTSVEVLG